MKFNVMLDPQLLLLAYSVDVVGDPAGNERYVFEAEPDRCSFERRELVLNRAGASSRFNWIDAGYTEVTSFATKASTFLGHDKNLQKFHALFRRYWNQGVMVDEPAQYANPLNAMLRWAREQPGIGAPGQATMSLPLVPVLVGNPPPSKYDFCR